MRYRLFILLVSLVLYLLVEVYIYFGFKSVLDHNTNYVWFTVIYIIFTLFAIGGFFSQRRTKLQIRSVLANFLMGLAFTIVITKLIFCGLLLAHDTGRLIIARIFNFGAMSAGNVIQPELVPGRIKDLTTFSVWVTAVIFVTLLFGITYGKYRYKVTHLRLRFRDLPKSFDGFRILQISDIHSGSFDSIQQVQKGVNLAEKQKADLIFCTGDLVNSHKDEINPFIPVFRNLSAPFGKYCVLGNHDYYGSYRLQSDEARREYWDDFHIKIKEMGFTLLNNSNAYIRKNDERISILGVENWGRGKWFQKDGNLDIALEGTEPHDFFILLSHDPSHWEDKVLSHKQHIHLTLSGHTHGFQFGLNVLGYKWSPMKLRHKRWIGLYRELDQYLYINRGFGFLGFPGRVGMWPEITVIELNKI